MLGSLHNLDVIEKKRKQWGSVSDQKPIDSDEEFNRFMFSALRFTERDKRSISR